MLAGLADNERFIYFLITFVTLNSIQNDQFPANIWVPLCCHPLFGDVNQRKSGKRNNLSQTCKHKLAETVFNSISYSFTYRVCLTLYDVVPKEEIAEFEEFMRKTIADIVSEASSIACWVYVQKYVKQKTLDEMLQELPGAGQFIIVMDTWFERLMAE